MSTNGPLTIPAVRAAKGGTPLVMVPAGGGGAVPAPGAPWIGTTGVGVTVVTPLPPTVEEPGPPQPCSVSGSLAAWLQSSIRSIRPEDVTFCWSTRHCACGRTLPNEPPK